ncbi:MAG: hypothetical protein JOZ51_01185 [Chloroflexi bacterium]|nr:hypothetical protein [Chloroflexota bacterium]
MSANVPHDPTPPDALPTIAAYLRRHGLATPALMLLQIARPLSFLGSQSLLLIQPILPVHRWQAGIGQTARALEDEAAWTRLEKLLQ